jgi:hypothetical protein
MATAGSSVPAGLGVAEAETLGDAFVVVAEPHAKQASRIKASAGPAKLRETTITAGSI